jgi:hypothetical protein
MDPKDEESFSRKSCMYGWDLICKWISKMRKASQGSTVCTVGILICKWIPKMRKASQGSLDLKDDESFLRKSYMSG